MSQSDSSCLIFEKRLFGSVRRMSVARAAGALMSARPIVKSRITGWGCMKAMAMMRTIQGAGRR